MDDLIRQLEEAEGSNRELDTRIWLAVTPGATRKQWSYKHRASGSDCHVDETRDASHELVIVPPYTSSIDAALTLVPEGWVFSGLQLARAPDMGGRMWNASVRGWREVRSNGQRTPALALCIAALRAREVGDG